MSILGNALGVDLSTLKKELSKFQQTQIETNTLLRENNQLLTQILTQLGGKPTDKLESF
jgi:hypothetical protein